jgi:hypothetical protein
VKRYAIFAYLLTALFTAQPARADLFGGDVVVLSQIFINAVEQLAKLRQMVSAGKDNLDLLRDINKGISDSLNLIRTASPQTDPGLYKNWREVQESLRNLENLYGIVVPSNDEHVQRDADQSIAEAITMNNSIYEYTKQIDEIGELIKQQSHFVSPAGAAKLTAQSMGVMLHVQNESLRAQAMSLKLQAQAFATENRQAKDRTRQMLEGAENLNVALAGVRPTFQLPRF